MGLVSRLPISFWIGVGLLGLLWFVGRNSKYKAATALVMTIMFLNVAPAIIKTPVWLSNSYYPFGEALLINSNGHLVSRPLDILTSYHYWPLFLYLTSIFTLVTGIPDYFILKLLPLLTISMYGLLTFLILRGKVKSVYAMAGAAWFIGSFWLRQHYFGPPSISFIFFLTLALIGSWLFLEEKKEKQTFAARFLFILFFTALTLTHALTSLMALMFLLGMYLARRFVVKKRAHRAK